MKTRFAQVNSTIFEPTEEEIAAMAYHLYLERGRGDGNDLGDWFRARDLLAAARRSKSVPMEDPIDENRARSAGQATPATSAASEQSAPVKTPSKSGRRRQSEPAFA
jgi:hypothetical protein